MRRFFLWTHAVGVLWVGLSAGCTAGEVNTRQCVFNSDCAAPLICAGGLCRAECVTDDDCPANSFCKPSDRPDAKVCLNASGQCAAIPAAQPRAPYSGERVYPSMFTMRWALPPGTDGAHVQICADRACASVLDGSSFAAALDASRPCARVAFSTAALLVTYPSTTRILSGESASKTRRASARRVELGLRTETCADMLPM